jgi:hypothetical protein
MDLFRVRSLVPEHRGYLNVTFHWWVESRKQPLVLPYATLIQDYDALSPEERVWPEGALTEMFTGEEAAALGAYLKEEGDDTVLIERASLPIPSNLASFGANAVGGLSDFLMISERDTYRLPFRVWGFYDLHGCERELEVA